MVTRLLTQAEASDIRRTTNLRKISNSDLAKRYGVSERTIGRAANQHGIYAGTPNQDVTPQSELNVTLDQRSAQIGVDVDVIVSVAAGPAPAAKSMLERRGRGRAFSMKEAEDIRNRYRRGDITASALAGAYGAKDSTIWRVLRCLGAYGYDGATAAVAATSVEYIRECVARESARKIQQAHVTKWREDDEFALIAAGLTAQPDTRVEMLHEIAEYLDVMAADQPSQGLFAAGVKAGIAMSAEHIRADEAALTVR